MENKKEDYDDLDDSISKERLTKEQLSRIAMGYTCDHCVRDYCICRGRGFSSNLAITCKQFKVN